MSKTIVSGISHRPAPSPSFDNVASKKLICKGRVQAAIIEADGQPRGTIPAVHPDEPMQGVVVSMSPATSATRMVGAFKDYEEHMYSHVGEISIEVKQAAFHNQEFLFARAEYLSRDVLVHDAVAGKDL
ncbi:hypothetical protein Landi51_08943 [Colletotrichum acutatum]